MWYLLHIVISKQEGGGGGVINITMRCIIINMIHNDLDVL